MKKIYVVYSTPYKSPENQDPEMFATRKKAEKYVREICPSGYIQIEEATNDLIKDLK